MHRVTTRDVGNETACIAMINAPAIGVGHFPKVGQVRHRVSSPCPNRINITVTALWVATPILSTVSVAAVCVAVGTNQWLETQENIKNGNYTGKGDQEYFPKSTVSGLWTLCYTNPGRQGFFCSNIEYFPKEEYSPDLKDSTMAIPYTVTKSAAFFMLSTFLLFVGEICCLFGHFSRQRRLLTFISGVIFIVSGLLMLIGLVMYISIFKAEIGGKLRPTSQLQPAVFTYKYGYSFILYVSGFVSTEISGTCAVFLYIYWHQKDWRKKESETRSKFVSHAFAFDVEPIGRLYPFCRKHPPFLSDAIQISGGISDNFSPPLQPRLCLNDRPEIDCVGGEFYSPICLKHSLSCGVINEFLSDGNLKSIKNRLIDANHIHPPERCLNDIHPPDRCQRHPTSGGHSENEFWPPNNFSPVGKNKMEENWMKGGEPPDRDLDECSSGTNHEHDFVPFDLDENVPVPDNCKNREAFLNHEELFYKVLSKSTPV